MEKALKKIKNSVRFILPAYLDLINFNSWLFDGLMNPCKGSESLCAYKVSMFAKHSVLYEF